MRPKNGEANVRDRARSDCTCTVKTSELDWDVNLKEIDAQIRGLVAEITKREVAIGRLAERFRKADGWRRLGFATEAQYARERLGVSPSCIEAKRRLARALRVLPRWGEAIEKRQLGYEAARLVASVANGENVGAWIERAEDRTVKRLREEVDALQMSALRGLGSRLLDRAQMFSPGGGRLRARGRVTLRLRVTAETARFYRWLADWT